MGNYQDKTSAINLSIANIGLSLLSDDTLFIDQLASGYRFFQALDPATKHLVIHTSQSPMKAAWEQILPSFQADRILLSTHLGESYFDFSAGSGQIHLATSRPIEEIDYALRVVYSFLAFQAGGLMLHAAGIVHKGKAYLFLGESGSGKTTVARLSKADTVLNDDLVILMPDQGRWVVHSTPFWNPSQIRPSPASADLAGLFRLQKGLQVSIEAVSEARSLAELIACTPVVSTHPESSSMLIRRCEAILQFTPLFQLHFLPDNTFWEAIEARVGD